MLDGNQWIVVFRELALGATLEQQGLAEQQFLYDHGIDDMRVVKAQDLDGTFIVQTSSDARENELAAELQDVPGFAAFEAYDGSQAPTGTFDPGPPLDGLVPGPSDDSTPPPGSFNTTTLAPAALGHMILLSNGTVMVQGSGISSTWYQLAPDAKGNYANGKWSTLASMSTQRKDYGSNVLPSGQVFLLGGEYSGPAGAKNVTNKGEIYDPVSNSWSPIANFPQNAFGDDPTVILPDGRVLAGYIFGPQTYIYDPASNTWSQTGTKLRGDRSDEETWTKLPDGGVLSYDIWQSPDSGPGFAQRFDPLTNTWIDAGSVPVPLSGHSVDEELGPGLQLPDGRIFLVGATNNTALYNPTTNTWTAGPTLPANMGGDDTPGAVLPNGHVIFAADTSIPNFTAPTRLFDFDPSAPIASSLTEITGQPGFPSQLTSDLNHAAFTTRMLVLPSGQVLINPGTSSRIWIYTPDGGPSDSWRPAITSIANNGGGIYTLTGTQLNGLSEGAAYGDDAEMSSNYPIVQLTSTTTGNIYYARSFNWSSTGIATGDTPVSTQFSLPAGLPDDAYLVRVIANGIASAPESLDGSLLVAGSTPAAGSSVSSPPTSFSISFTEAIDPASLQANDLLVNGIAATSVTLDTPASAIFTFADSPGVNEGLQMISIVAGSIDKTSDPTQGITAFNTSFRYDAIALAATTTAPVAGGTFTLPGPFTYVVNFNEPISADSIGTDDLTLTSGAVTAAVLTGLSQANYTISGVTAEGSLGVTIAAGKVTDTFGNPNPAPFSATYQIDVATSALTTPLTAIGQPGSLLYGTTAPGVINVGGDTDTFTLPVDPGQTISVLVTPTTGTLRPNITLRSPSNASLGTVSSGAINRPVVLPVTPTTTGGTYSIVIGSVNSTTGGYTVQVILNAAIEQEGNGSSANDTSATAQGLVTSQLTLQTTQSTGLRSAVVGGNPAGALTAFSTSNFESGQQGYVINNNVRGTGASAGLWHLTTRRGTQTGHSASTSFYYGKDSTGMYDTGAANAGTITSSPIIVPSAGPISLSFNYLLQTEGNSGLFDLANVQVSNDGGATFTTVASSSDPTQLPESAVFRAASFDLSAYAGQTIELRFSFDTVDAVANTFEGWYVDDVQLSSASQWKDYYSFTTTSPSENVTVALKNQTGSGTNVFIETSSGIVVGTGATGPTNFDRVLNLTISTPGTYFLRVSGNAAATYSATITRNTAFDTEPNDTLATAQVFASNTSSALGAITPTNNEDWYSLSLTAGTSYRIETGTPADGQGEFANTFDPHIELRNSSIVVATSSTLPDGRNEFLNFTPATTGTYFIHVTAQGGTTGEYFLTRSTADTVPPRVIATSVAAGSIQSPGSQIYTVTFSESMKTGNLDTADFMLQGLFHGQIYSLNSFGFNADGTVLTLNYIGQPDDSFTLTLVAGANGGTNFTDVAGNALDGDFTGAFPSGDGTTAGNFVLNFSKDVVTEPFPTPLSAVSPAGSLIYDPSVSRVIAFAGDTDSYSFDVDAGQTISVLVNQANSGLRPSIELRDPLNNLLGSASATVNIQPVFFSAIPVTIAGTYTLTVTGANTNRGLYVAQVILNSALEAENNAGAANDSRTAAQSIDNSFLALPAVGRPASRGAVLGGNAAAPAWDDFYSFTADPNTTISAVLNQLAGSGVSMAIEDGSGTVLATATPGATNYSAGLSNLSLIAGGTYYVHVSGVAAGTYSVVVTMNAAFDTERNDTFDTAEDISGVAGALGAIVTLADSSAGSTVVPNNLADLEGNSSTAIPFSPASSRFQQIYSASQFASGGIIDAIRFRRDKSQAPFTLSGLNVQVDLAYAAATIDAPSDAFVNNIGGGDMTVYNGPLTLTSSGVGSPNPFDIVIDVDDSFYYNPALGNLLLDVRVTGPGTTNVFFDASTSSQQSSTIRIYNTLVTNQGGNIGGTNDGLPFGLVTRFDFLNPTPNDDWYSLNVTSASPNILLQTSTPGDGPNQFLNTLDPHIELYDPMGNLVASGAVLSDGRNESIDFHAPGLTQGAYRIRVTGENSTWGEYFLRSTLLPDEAPTAGDDSVSMNEDTSTAISVLTNDSDPDGSLDPSSVTVGTAPAHGIASVDPATGQITYTPNPNYSGPDSFTYTVQDDSGALSNTATANLSVIAVADSPTLTVSDATGDEASQVPLAIGAALTDTDGSESLAIQISGVPALAQLSAGTNQGAGVWLLASTDFSGLTISNPDDATFALTIAAIATEASNGSQATTSDTLNVTFNNIPAILTISGASTIVEGNIFVLSLVSIDPGADTITDWTINWGDGSPPQPVDGNPSSVTHVFMNAGGYTIAASATDEDGSYDANQLPVTVQDDGDGIATPIDRNSLTGDDERAFFSNDFNDGFTSGSILDRGGGTVTVTDITPGGVCASLVTAGSGVTKLGNFGGTPKEIWLDQSGEVADVTQLGGGTIQVTAVSASPAIEIWKYYTGYSALAVLHTGDTISTGSPFTASASNVEPITVELFKADGTSFGQFPLDPGESVDVNFALGQTPEQDLVELSVLAGTVPITIQGFTFTISTGDSLQVPTSNLPPTPSAGGPYMVGEATSLTLNGLASTDPDQPSSTLTYEWDLNYNGSAFNTDVTGPTPTVSFPDNFAARTIALRVTDLEGLSAIATTTLTVVNLPPVATPNSYSTTQATITGGNVITDSTGAGADGDPAGTNDPLTISSFTQTTNGTLLVSADGSFSYQPDSTFSRDDSFTYTINDGDGGYATATVTIHVSAAGAGSSVTIPDTSLGGSALLITGTSLNDTIVVEPGASSTTLKVTINGASTTVPMPSGRIIVLGGAGDDNIQIAGANTNPAWLYGEAGNDRLNNGNGGGLLIGGDGNDQLLGGTGRDVMIGGEGADSLNGNSGDDILIAGFTLLDSRTAAGHEQFWSNVLKEWTSGNDFATRVQNLRNGNGGSAHNAGALLLPNVRDDLSANAVDFLNGAAGDDWLLFLSGEDKISGQLEQAN